MKPRNHRALRDVTPGNTPRSKRTSSRATKLKERILGHTARIPALSVKDVVAEDVLPKVSVLPAPASPSVLPVASSRAQLDSTPVRPSTRAHHSAKMVAGPSHDLLLSPLPPSSPPSMSSYDEDAENRPPLHLEVDVHEVEGDNDDEMNVPVEEHAHTKAKHPSSDDPFGFTALERRLKVQREIRRRNAGVPVPMPAPKGKGKEIAPRRAPFGELLAVPVTSPSATRAPTPYHPSDDLEDMYLDISQVQPREPSHAPVSEELSEADLAPPIAAQPTPSDDDDDDDPTRTPRPRHVANIIPLASPFSSREGTPCDRSLPESPLSSPSPIKPLTASRPLPVQNSSTAKKKRQSGIIPSKGFPSSTPIPTPLPAARRARISPLSTKGIRPVLLKKGLKDRQRLEETVEDPMTAAQNLEKLLPKRARRRKGKDSGISGRSLPAKERKQTQEKGESDYSSRAESSEDEPYLSSSPLAKGKRRLALRRQYPVKRMKVEVVITKRPPRPTGGGRAKPATRAKPESKAKSSRGKGKERAGTQKVGDENSVRAPGPSI